MDSHEAKTEGSTMDSGDQGRDIAGMTSTSGREVNSGRRNFAKVGLAAPVLLAMVNRTAWAGPACAPSAFMSATFASHHPEQAQLCDLEVGCSPGFWMNHPCAWVSFTPDSELENKTDPCPGDVDANCYSKGNSKFFRNGTTFSAAFGCAVSTGDASWTLMEVLQKGHGNALSNGNIEWHAVAALLNAASNQPNYNLSEAEVKEIFCALIISGEHLNMSWRPFWEDYFDNYACTDNGKDPNCVGFVIASPPPGNSSVAPGQNK